MSIFSLGHSLVSAAQNAVEHAAETVTGAASSAGTQAGKAADAACDQFVRCGDGASVPLGADRLTPEWLSDVKTKMRKAQAHMVDEVVSKTLQAAGVDVEKYRDVITKSVSFGLPQFDEMNRLYALVAAAPRGLANIAIPGINNKDAGADGQTYVVVARPKPPGGYDTRPYDPNTDKDAIYYTNGMNESQDSANQDAEELSRQTGKPVVITYNATNGGGVDFLQCIADQLNRLPMRVPGIDNKATISNEDLMYAAAKGDDERTFVAYSQGGIITRNALIRVHTRLYCEKFAEVLKETGNPVRANREATDYANSRCRHIHVITAGGAGWLWPPYANVSHVTNQYDIVPNAFGQNWLAWEGAIATRDGVREQFGVDLTWLPDGDQYDTVDEAPDKGNYWSAHNFRRTYVDDVVNQI